MSDTYIYSGSYRWAAGTLTRKQLTTTYEIVRFPRQLDMPNILDWTEPLDPGEGVFTEGEDVEALDGSMGIQGGGEFDWHFLWTPLQIVYVKANLFAGRRSGPMTMMTFDAERGFRVVNATGRLHSPKNAERMGFGYDKYRISFVRAVEAASGYAYGRGYSSTAYDADPG